MQLEDSRIMIVNGMLLQADLKFCRIKSLPYFCAVKNKQ